MEFQNLCESVRDDIFSELRDRKVQTEEEYDGEVDDIQRQEMDYTIECMYIGEKGTLLGSLGYAIGKYVKDIVCVDSLDQAGINNYILYLALEDQLHIGGYISFAEYQEYCKK